MALLNQKAFERKLQNMSSTQDSVQTVSLWMIHHKKHADDMVTVWLEQLKKAPKADRRLVLFYLANDVLQNSRKKGKEFSNAFTKILREAMQLLSDKTIKANVQRVIKIWEERRLFEKDYIEALKTNLDLTVSVSVVTKKPKEKIQVVEKEKEKEVKPPPKQKRLPPADFKPSKLIDALKALRNFEGELTLKESQLNSLRIDASDLESVRQLKDRTGGGKFCEEYELATSKLEEFSETLRREQQERADIIKALEDGEAFYDASYGEVKVIVNAYKTFGNRLTSLKKKVDTKVNRLAQKAAEKAKTGPVSAPQASFLTSGLPDVGDGSASSTPSQAQQEADKSPEEDKPIDPTVDNIEVADMDVDSDSEKSDTSEEASVEDAKSSNDQTPNSTESSDSQPAQTTPQEPEITPMISPASSVAPAQPLTPSMGSVMPVQGSMLPNQPPIVAPRAGVGIVIRPFMGVHGVRFPGPAPGFRPGVPPMQPLPGMHQNPLLQPSRSLPGPGQILSQGQPFSQMPRPTGLLPNANASIPGGMRTLQPFPLHSGFVHSQAPLPVAATTVPVQMTHNPILANEKSQGSGGLSQAVANIGSPFSDSSAPSPVGSPELHLVEGDETPETTPAPLGDVDVKDNTGFDTRKSFLENLVTKPTTSLGLGFPGAPSASKAVSESPSSSNNSTPSTSDQFGGQQQDVALVKKDNGQNVSAVDILAQLLSRGRKLKETADPDVHPTSVAVTPPVASPAASNNNAGNPQSKPLLSLIDSLFPKLSDSIKTLKEKEKAVNLPEAQHHPPSIPVINTPSSLPARPLPIEGQIQHPLGIAREQPPFQQTGLKSILKKGPRKDQDLPEFMSNHSGVQDVTYQGPARDSTSSNFPEEMAMIMPLEMRLDDAQAGPRHGQDLRQLEQQGNRLSAINEDAVLSAPTSHLVRPGPQLQSPPIRGALSQVPQERPFDRPLDMSPHGPSPFGPRGPFHAPPFNQFWGNTGPPFVGVPTDMPGPRHIHSHRGPPFERLTEGPPNMPGQAPTDQPPHGHAPRGPPDMPEQVPLHLPPHGHSVRGPPFERRAEGPPNMPGQAPTDQPPHGHAPRGPPDMPEQVPLHLPPHGHSVRGPPFERRAEGPNMPGQAPTDQPPHGHAPRGPPDMPEQVPLHLPPHGHSPRGPPFERHDEGPPTDQPPHGHSIRGLPFERLAEGPPNMPGQAPTDQLLHGHSIRGPLFERITEGPPNMPGQAPTEQPPHGHSPRAPPFERYAEGPPELSGQIPTDQPPHGHPDMSEQVPPHRPPHVGPRGPPPPERVATDQSPHGHSSSGSFKDGPPQVLSDPSRVHRQSTEDDASSYSGPSKPSDVPEEENPSNNDEKSDVDGPPGVRRLSSEGASRGLLHRQPPHEQVPRSDGPPPHRASFPGVMDDIERRREFKHWEECRRERYGGHARGPWDIPYDHPGLPPPDWRGPPFSPHGDPNRADFREDDPSMWTSFENPGRSPRHVDFPSRTHEEFREGPPEFARFRDYGPPERRRHSIGDFEGGWVRYPGPLKRPGPPPVPFPGPSKRPYY